MACVPISPHCHFSGSGTTPPARDVVWLHLPATQSSPISPLCGFKTDGSRSLNLYEFTKGLNDYGVFLDDKPAYQDCYDRFDSNGDGSIDFDEFLKALRVSSAAVWRQPHLAGVHSTRLLHSDDRHSWPQSWWSCQ